MDRIKFLAQPDVRGFVDWLCLNLAHLNVHLRFSPSRFVKGGINRQVVGIEGVHALYRWESSWSDYQTGRSVISHDWDSTILSLDLLRDRLLTSMANGCEATTYKACLAVLRWGGVRGAVPFLNQLRQQGKLVQYLDSCRSLFVLDGSQVLSQLNKQSIWRFDAGLTKIHSLIDTTGSPIYDSRVGAAIAMLYAVYRQEATCRAVLSFPSGAARGSQIRDPGELGYASAPQFFTLRVPAVRWAQSQVELGWIIRNTLQRASELFPGTPEERCRMFEAALFMIGYDLRCLAPPHIVSIAGVTSSASLNNRIAEHAGTNSSRTWVPTSVPFPQVLQEYLECSRSEGQTIDLAAFREWQISVKARTLNTAASYCAPFRAAEFDLVSYGLNDLELIARGGEAGLKVLSAGESGFVAGDEREQVYLVSAFLCGRSVQLAAELQASPVELLVGAGFAGGEGSAKLLLRIGRAVGQHFNLLDGERPTELFEAFFGQALTDLDERLQEVSTCAGVKDGVSGGAAGVDGELEYSPEFATMILGAASGEFEETDDLIAILEKDLARLKAQAGAEGPNDDSPDSAP